MNRSSVWTVAAMMAAGAAAAGEFELVNPRALGTGGAGVGGAQGAYAVYFNPAGLAETEAARERIALSVHLFGRDRDFVDFADRLADYDWNDITDDPLANAADALAVADILREIPDGAALLAGGGGLLYAQIGRFGCGVRSGTQLALIPEVDKLRLNPTPAADPLSIANNQSAFVARGLAVAEVPIAYAYPIETGAGRISLGVALKYISAVTYNGRVVVTAADSETIEDELKTFDKQDTGFGLDAGAQFAFTDLPVRVGVLARNINSPEFDTVGGETFEDPLQVRAGVEWAVVPGVLSLAGECDITRNETLLPGYESQLAGVGLTLEGFPSIFALALRAGVMKNLAESDDGLLYTGGIGAGLKWFHVELSAAVSDDETTYDGDQYPREARVALSIESAW